MLSTNGKVTTNGNNAEEVAALPESIQTVMAMIDQPLKVEITDGRVLVGHFHCLDRDQNLILTDTIEYRFPQESADASPSVRSLGMTLIPGRHVVKVSKKQES